MSFDGVMLKHVVKELNEALLNTRITKIYQLGLYDLLFQVRGQTSQSFLMSTSSNHTRLHLTAVSYEKPSHPPRFCMFLRKHIEGAFINTITQHNNDRVVTFKLGLTNDFGERIEKHLIFEALGKDANIILTTSEGIILDALKRTGPFDHLRTIYPSAHYQYPPDERINPYNTDSLEELLSLENLESIRDYLDKISGISPLFVNEFLHRLSISKHQKIDIFKTMLDEEYYHILTNNKTYFSSIKLNHLSGNEQLFTTPQALFDAYFFTRDKVERRHQKAKDLLSLFQRQIEKLKAKLEKLNKDLDKSSKLENLKEFGQLILTHQNEIIKGDRFLQCLSFDGTLQLSIPLDIQKTPIQNSNDYFRKYRKTKNSIPHIKTQISTTYNDLEFFNLLKTQLDHADLSDIDEMREELINEKYLPKKSSSIKKSKKPLYSTYQDKTKTTILVGKNNLQNAHITHKEALSHDVWFHVQSGQGSHVLVKSPQPLSEETIRCAAQLAVHFSPHRYSSSVPVDYTDAKWIKKIPGKRPCFVRYQNQKTMYIDPNETYINGLKKL